jgi:hypothetical protein
MGIEFNGKNLERQILEAAKKELPKKGLEIARKKILAALGPIDAEKITLTVEGGADGMPTIRVDGPEHLKAKIEKIKFSG